MGQYYRVPVDDRDMNYSKFFIEGEPKIADFDDYTSHNTERLSVDGVKKLLTSIEYIKELLNA